MITQIQGELIAIHNGTGHLQCDSLTYELLIPAFDIMRLSTMVSQHVIFHTLHYLEGQAQGSSFIPRLIGFTSAEDRAFFSLFTTVKGLGNRKALRALELPFHTVATAIAQQDTDLLVSLPEIGKRTAQSIIAELQGKVDRFIESKPDDHQDISTMSEATVELIRDAVAVLVQLGEPKLQARQLADRALAADPAIPSAEELVTAAYRLKAAT